MASNRATPTEPGDLHEWVSFDDPDEARTWVFDLTFLSSNWTCIFGQGCSGVLTGPAPELEQGCCSYGAHFTDDADRKRVEAMAERLDAEQWQFRSEALELGGPIHVDDNGETVSHLVDDACIFLNRPGFGAGAGCALHQAALSAGENFIDWKPDVCWQLPLRRVDETDDYGHVTSTVREWKRRDWGEGGHDFHWWCTDAPDAFVGTRPVHQELRQEIIALTTPWAYEQVVEHLAGRRNGSGTAVPLPHPAVRR